MSKRTPARKLLPVGLIAVAGLALALQPADAPASAGTKPAAKAGTKADAAPRPASPARLAAATSEPISSADAAALKEAIAAARKGNTSHAADLQATIGDPVARKLVEWAILRSDDNDSIEFRRYTTFIAGN